LPSAETISNSFALTSTQDFSYLREKGLQYIQKLSGKLWTDHNLHDPGITILEVLCYALMDLGYRTNFSMKDLVTEPDGSIDRENAFHPAHKIFTTHPVTIEDYRKILVDIPGIRNAWLFTKDENEKTFDEGIKLFAYCKNSELLYESEIDTKIPELTDREHVRQNEELRIKGLYAVRIEPDEHPILGDLSSNTVSVKIVKGELAATELEIVFPHWSAKDKNNNEIVSMLKAAKIDQLAVELINDTTLKKKDFEALKRSQWKTRWIIKYGAQERVLENVMVKLVKTHESFKGLIKGDALQKALLTPVGTEALKRFRQRPREIFKIFSIVREKLMEHRNLCEDFLYNIDTVDTEELSICADLDVEGNADLETIQAYIFDKVENYLLPPVQFSTLKELLDANVPVEEIFNGPLLEHGFLTNEAIKNADLKREYYISDIISLLMDIPGVLNVRNFKFSVSKNGISQPSLHDWKVIVTSNHKLKLKREKCKLLYFKNNLPLNASFRESVNKLQLQQSLQAHLKFKNTSQEIDLPPGKYRNLGKHYTILNEFPRVYVLGDKDPPEDVSIERKVQVKQLEAYLTFFDQLLADYCSQLMHLKDILSWKESPAQTYFTQFFYTKDAGKLFWQKDFLSSKLSTDFLSGHSEVEKDYLKDKTGLQYLKESTATYLDRRNRILDHLIARFSESFNDYALYMYGLPDERVMDDETVSHDLIKSKLRFLKNYELLSKERSKAFNYSIEEAEVLETSNLSGYSKRMRALLGMTFDKTRELHNLPDDDMGGFHLLEHLMLRPSKEGDALLGVCLDPQCDHCGEEDPYSFRISIVLPFWLKRFKNIAFRNFMETLFRTEAPAHALLKICWVDKTEMKKFEEAMAGWLKTKAAYYKAFPAPQAVVQKNYSEALKKLIDNIQSLRTDFPEATLHDCVDRDETNDNRVFLGHTALGTFNPTENE